MSTEWTSVAPYGGPDRAGIVALMRPVAEAARAPLPLRVGGASGDESWWNPEHRLPRPPHVVHDIDGPTLDALAALGRGLGGAVTLGLNLQSADPGNALALARAAERRLGARLDGLEIGNEPDLYTRARTSGPLPVRRLRKRATYTPANYAREAGVYLDALAAALPARDRPRLIVGGFAGTKWAGVLPGLVGAHPGIVGGMAAHRYGVAACQLRPDAGELRAQLLSTEQSRLEGLAPLIALAHARGLPLRLAELNSAPCGGAPGVSDTFTAALWLTDALFTVARAGADGADVHTWDGAVYAPFARRGRAVTARPPYYGMLAFARAAPRGSRLVPARVTGNGRVRAWATRDRDGTVRLALIAATGARRVRVRIADAGGRPCATVRVTSAPSLAARTGIVDRAAPPACPRGGAIALTLPGPSLAVVTLPARAG